MIVWLSWEATERIIYDDKVIKADIMLFTAFVSLACNIFNLVALGHCHLPCIKHEGPNFMDSIMSVYKPHGGHNHSHGDGGCGGHGHSQGHGHGNNQGATNNQGHGHGHGHGGNEDKKELVQKHDVGHHSHDGE